MSINSFCHEIFSRKKESSFFIIFQIGIIVLVILGEIKPLSGSGTILKACLGRGVGNGF